MFRYVRLLLIGVLVAVILPMATPSAAQDQIAALSASQRYGFMAPATWIASHQPTVGLQFGVPTEAVTLASSPDSLTTFRTGARSFFFEKWDFDFRGFQGAVLTSLLWPNGLNDSIYLDDYKLRYGLEYINDEYGNFDSREVQVGPFSGTHYQRQWRGLSFNYYWLTNANGETLLISALADSAHAELLLGVINSLRYNEFPFADLTDPFGDPLAVALNGGVSVNLPLGWWSLGGVREQYFTIIGPSADLLRAVSFFPYSRADLNGLGVVMGSYRWTKDSPSTDWVNEANSRLGISLNLLTHEALGDGQSAISFTARLPEFRNIEVAGRGRVWETETEVIALLALGNSGNLTAFEPNINAVFASAHIQSRAIVDELQTVSPRSGRYALDIPADWYVGASDTEVLSFNFQGIFPSEGILISSNPQTLAFLNSNILAEFDFVSYGATPADIDVLIGTIIPADMLELIGFSADEFEQSITGDFFERGGQRVPLELRGLTGTRYTQNQEGTVVSLIVLQDEPGNLYFFVMAASGGGADAMHRAIDTLRVQSDTTPVEHELAPDALLVTTPAGWWGGDARLEAYTDQRVPVISPSGLLIGIATLEEPDDWEYDYPTLRADMLRGVILGGMTFIDLSGVQEFIRSDGSLNTRLLALYVIGQLDAESEVTIGDISEWSNANGLNGTLVEFSARPYFTLRAGSGTVAIDGFVLGVPTPQGLAVLVAVSSHDQIEQNRPLIEGIFASARLK